MDTKTEQYVATAVLIYFTPFSWPTLCSIKLSLFVFGMLITLTMNNTNAIVSESAKTFSDSQLKGLIDKSRIPLELTFQLFYLIHDKKKKRWSLLFHLCRGTIN